jgi:hypothetical protein
MAKIIHKEGNTVARETRDFHMAPCTTGYEVLNV